MPQQATLTDADGTPYTVDFHATFPRPTAGALPQLRCGQHYPDPDDELMLTVWHRDLARGIVARLHALHCMARVCLSGRSEEEREKVEHEALCLSRQITNTLIEYERIYGHEATKALVEVMLQEHGPDRRIREDYSVPYQLRMQGNLFD